MTTTADGVRGRKRSPFRYAHPLRLKSDAAANSAALKKRSLSSG